MSDRTADKTQGPIAVVGLGSLYPGSDTPEGFWKDIIEARSRMTDVPDSHWLIEDFYDPNPRAADKTYCKRGAFLSPTEFDPMEFGVPPSMIPATDTAQLLSLIVARNVLDDVAMGQSGDPKAVKIDRDRTSVILGFAGAAESINPLVARLQRPIWEKSLRDHGIAEADISAISERIVAHYQPWEENSFPGVLGNVVAGRIANRLDLHGSNMTADAACASSLAAVHSGVSQLMLGEADLVITGGVDANNDIFVYMCFSKTPAMSPTGDCRPFSDKADGTMMGEGMGMIALKRLADAERDGNRIYAVLRGIGFSSDGRSKSIYAPRSDGQARALRRAYERAGYDPQTVELIEAHGTGTKAGDAAEMAGLRMVFGGAPDSGRPHCALGSVKSQIGHTAAAAGAAGLMKIVMALHQRVLPPTINVERPDPELNLQDSPFYINTQARPWIRDSRHPRRASVSAFGFGGTNYHIAVEEYVSPDRTRVPTSLRTTQSELFVFGADTSRALAESLPQSATGPSNFTALAHASQLAFDAASRVRLAIVASDRDDLNAKLVVALNALKGSDTPDLVTPTGIYLRSDAPDTQPIALLFPGQGSQYVGMGAELAMALESVRSIWDAHADTRFDNTSIAELTFPPPVFDAEALQAQEDALRATAWAQPALGLASLAAFDLAQRLGLKPARMIGHSFGELSALCAAGAMTPEDLLQLGRQRGVLMAQAAQSAPGGMIAIFTAIETARALVAQAGDDVVIANINAHDEVIASGTLGAIDRLEALCAKSSITARRLPVAAAFHSPAVSGAGEAFAKVLETIDLQAPSTPVSNNVHADLYPAEPHLIRQRLAEQLSSPVRFLDQIEAAYADGVRTFVEVGPGAILSDLTRRILKGKPHAAVSFDRKGRNGFTSLNHALAQLATAGHAIQFAALWEGYLPPKSRPAARSGSTITLSGTNYKKPYPPNAKTRLVAKPAPKPATLAPKPAVAATAIAAAAPAAPLTAAFTPTPAAFAPSAAAQTPVQPQPQPMPAPGASVPTRSDGERAWLTAYQEIQRKTAETHSAFTQAMADSHAAFLSAMTSSFSDLNAGISRQPMARPQLTSAHFAVVEQPSPSPALAPPPSTPAPLAVEAPPRQIAAPAAPKIDLAALLMSIVAEKTGYQADMLAPHMDLEADLGIDSIKRVEILAAVRDAVPSLPDVKASDMATIRTLADVIAYLEANPAAEGDAPPTPAPSPSAVASDVDVAALLMTIVAEKTGYQAEMLAPHMDLEADLGIDSIKRVEILAAVRDAVPSLPDVKASDMAAIRTLADVISYLEANPAAATDAAAPVASPAVSVPSPASSPSNAGALAQIDLSELVMAIVAEKTGYQASMLAPHMDLEADLGIDSIKRVEILAAIRDAVPSLPDVKATDMAAIRTLGDVVAYLNNPDALASAGIAEPLGSSAATVDPVRRTTMQLQPKAMNGFALGGLHACGELVIVGGSSELGEALVARLKDVGISARQVAEAPPEAGGVVFLAGLETFSTVDEAIAVNRRAFLAAKAVAPRFATEGGVFVTVQSTGGDFGDAGSQSVSAWTAGLSALVRTARIEWPKAGLKAIDCAVETRTPAEIADLIANELLSGGNELAVAYDAHGVRSVPVLVETPLREAATPQSAGLTKGGVVVASGGARGVTAACLIELARNSHAEIVLLGRSEPLDEPVACVGVESDPVMLTRALVADAQSRGEQPAPAKLSAVVRSVLASREIRATIAGIEAVGGKAHYKRVDVQNAEAVAEALAEVRAERGPIKGLVHGAGVIADKRITEKSITQFNDVLDTKVRGLHALLAATEADDLDVVCLFSSFVAKAGNEGQVDYSMANEVLNHVASSEAKRRDGQCVVKSIGWGPWDGGMVTPALRNHFAAAGIAVIPIKAGAEVFVAETRDHSSTVVLVGGPENGVIQSEQRLERRFDVLVDKTRRPELQDHAVNGTPVVPIAMVVEWFHRALAATTPTPCMLTSLKVLRGVKLTSDLSGDWLQIIVRGEPGALRIELIGQDGRPAYSAIGAPTTSTPMLHPVAGKGEPLMSSPIYDGVSLFHGPAFQVLSTLEVTGDDTLSAELVGLSAKGWPATDGEDAVVWLTDPAALDGMLQLGGKWAETTIGGGSFLPMAFGACHLATVGQIAGDLRATVKTKQKLNARLVCDIVLNDASGRTVAVIEGAEFVRRPDAPAAATNQTLSYV